MQAMHFLTRPENKSAQYQSFALLQFFPEVIVFSVPFNFKCCMICDCGVIPVITQNNLSIFFIPTFVILLTLFTILPILLLLSTLHQKIFRYHFPYQLSALFPLIFIFISDKIPTSCIFFCILYCIFCLFSSASKFLLSLSQLFLKYSHIHIPDEPFIFDLLLYIGLSCSIQI